MKRYLYAFFALILFCTPARSDEGAHAISMHGAPKYQSDFEKLDYVSAEAKKGGELKQSVIGTFDTLNAYNIKGAKAAGLQHLYDPLMRRVWDEPFSLYGLIAQKVIMPDDRSSITYILNPNARFHDGKPITATDIEYSFNAHKSHGKPVTRRVYGLVDKVEIIDDLTIKFSFGDGYDKETAMILSLMRIVPKHYWENKKFDETTLEPPIGSGPYKISSIDAGRSITYERVSDYWADDLPVNRYQYNFDTLIFDYYRDASVAFEAFKKGNVDIWRENDINRWVVGYKDAKNVEKVEFDHGRPEWLNAFIFNLRRDIFKDVRVRKALSLAFPYEWAQRNIYHNAVKPIDSVFPNSELSADNSTILLEQKKSERHRLRQASKLLKEAGWDIRNGVLVKGDEFLSFEILLNKPTDEKLALGFVQRLKKLGVQVDVRTVDSTQFLGRLNDFDYDMVSYRWINSLSPGNEQNIYWGSAAANKNGTRNYAGVQNDQIDEQINVMVNAKDRTELLTAAQRMDEQIIRNNYVIPLFYKGYDAFGVGKNIQYPKITPVYGPVIETWWTEK